MKNGKILPWEPKSDLLSCLVELTGIAYKCSQSQLLKGPIATLCQNQTFSILHSARQNLLRNDYRIVVMQPTFRTTNILQNFLNHYTYYKSGKIALLRLLKYPINYINQLQLTYLRKNIKIFLLLLTIKLLRGKIPLSYTHARVFLQNLRQ